MTTKVSNVSTFQVPIHATLNGRPVRILALGEQEGKSPVYLAVDLDGRWEAGRNEEVGPVLVHHLLQQSLDKLCCLVAFHRLDSRQPFPGRHIARSCLCAAP